VTPEEHTDWLFSPLDGSGVHDLERAQQHFTNWREFAQCVCAPIVEADGNYVDEIELLRNQSPYYLVIALYMADRALSHSSLCVTSVQTHNDAQSL
jgi:hypothetical protein